MHSLFYSECSSTCESNIFSPKRACSVVGGWSERGTTWWNILMTHLEIFCASKRSKDNWQSLRKSSPRMRWQERFIVWFQQRGIHVSTRRGQQGFLGGLSKYARWFFSGLIARWFLRGGAKKANMPDDDFSYDSIPWWWLEPILGVGKIWFPEQPVLWCYINWHCSRWNGNLLFLAISMPLVLALSI